MLDPVTAAVGSGLAATVNAAFTFTRFVYEIKNTSKDVKACLDLVRRVDEDIQYTISLRSQHIKQLSNNPEVLRRLDRIIKDACESILDVGRLLEGCRKEVHGGTVPFQGRVKWVLSDSVAFSRRSANLQQQHAAINIEIAYMRQLEALKPLKNLANTTIFENAELLSMNRTRSRLSVSSTADVPHPPRYTPPMPRRSTMSDYPIFDSVSSHQPSMSFAQQSSSPRSLTPQTSTGLSPPISELGVTPRPSIIFAQDTWQSTNEPGQSYVELEANAQPPPIPPKTPQWKPHHMHQHKMNPTGEIPKALVPGYQDLVDSDLPQRWRSFKISQDPTAAEKDKESVIVDPPPDIPLQSTSPSTMTTEEWVQRQSIPNHNEESFAVPSQELEASHPNASRQNNASSAFSHGTSPKLWNFPLTNQSQIWSSTPNLALRSFSTPKLESNKPFLTPTRNPTAMSSTSTSSQPWDVSAPDTPRSTPASVTSPISAPTSFYGAYLETSRDGFEEEEDPETAFYRDLKIQEEEKQRRRMARRYPRPDNSHIP